MYFKLRRSSISGTRSRSNEHKLSPVVSLKALSDSKGKTPSPPVKRSESFAADYNKDSFKNMAKAVFFPKRLRSIPKYVIYAESLFSYYKFDF